MTQADDATPTPSTGAAPSMISMKSVNKHFGALHVLQEIDLEVPRGQVVIVLGPSGSGKSTLCRTINRLEPIDSGEIAVDGKVLPAEGKALAALRADVGMVFQSFNLFAHKTILENVMLAPVKVRKKSSADAKKKASGAFSSTICPSAMKTTRFAARLAKPISWVTTTIVMPDLARLIMTSRTSLIISGSRAEVGSSKSMTVGSMARARAIATRCC